LRCYDVTRKLSKFGLNPKVKDDSLSEVA